MIWIAVDAMGGDRAPGTIVDGALAALVHPDLGVALVGAVAALEAELARRDDVDRTRVRIVDAAEAIAMDESPAAALRRKRGASISVASALVAKGDAAALFSAGHTGATVMAAHAAFGMVPGVDRPALAATIPTATSRPTVLLDVGASADCRPQHLLQFAAMGSVFARVAFGVDAPRIGLLSIGEEAGKGNELTRGAHRLLNAAPFAFVGNVEARDLYRGGADVIVCDGFTGNIALKVSEGLVDVIEGVLSQELFRRIDYSESGGAPLLGVAGITIVGHGRSSAKAVCNGIVMAYRFAAEGFMPRLAREALSTQHSAPGTGTPGARR